jgi:thiamine pyrophosphokinase
MIINIVAGAPERYYPDLNKYDNEDVMWASADRGTLYLLRNKITPTVAFGDFDSVTSSELEWINKRLKEHYVYPKEKDKTDLEIALQYAIDQKPDLIQIFGATGGRLDHSLINLQLLVQTMQVGITTKLIDRWNEVELKMPGLYQVEQNVSFPYISFIPFSNEVCGLTLNGMKYPLSHFTLLKGSTRCISNEIIKEKGTYSFHEGIIMVVRSRDENEIS